ncbi:MAG: glycosyl transferase family protein [Pseudomonadota bacterium]
MNTLPAPVSVRGTIVAADWGSWLDIGARELAFFAGFWFLLGALDDIAVDLLWWRRRSAPEHRHTPEGYPRRRFAVLVPAWDEAQVIAGTLGTMLQRWQHEDVQIFLGCYPNDPATLHAALALTGDPRLSIVINSEDGPTSKAQCLNRMWQALCHEERRSGHAFDAVVLHDAEDIVHRDALALYADKLETHAVVQLPVIPLIHPGSLFVSGHYADEFAEAHGKAMVVRDSLDAGLPLAGVGCAIDRQVLGRLATGSGAAPFSEDSLTEDYELGLLLHRAGARACFCRCRNGDGEWIATRAYFPHRLGDAVRQKSRWIAGIALSGWDRLGWQGGMAEYWMRLRDRRAMLSALVLLAAYGAIVCGGMVAIASWFGLITPTPFARPLQILLLANALFLLWRLVMRVVFTTRLYGLEQGLLAIPRMITANIITIMAARRAMMIYCKLLLGGPLRWDKTDHAVPEEVRTPAYDVLRVRDT